MISVTELKRWLETLDPNSSVAVDEGGLTLVEILPIGYPSEAYLEVGGIPLDDTTPVEDDDPETSKPPARLYDGSVPKQW